MFNPIGINGCGKPTLAVCMTWHWREQDRAQAVPWIRKARRPGLAQRKPTCLGQKHYHGVGVAKVTSRTLDCSHKPPSRAILMR